MKKKKIWKNGFVPHLHCFVTATNMCLVDEDIGNTFLPSHLQQHLLVVGSILWTKGLMFTFHRGWWVQPPAFHRLILVQWPHHGFVLNFCFKYILTELTNTQMSCKQAKKRGKTWHGIKYFQTRLEFSVSAESKPLPVPTPWTFITGKEQVQRSDIVSCVVHTQSTDIHSQGTD